MHIGSMLRMQYFIINYLLPISHSKNIARTSILDVGSYDVNGCYKELFDESKFHYTGLDMEKGLNVDLVPANIYKWTEISDDSFDVVISGQAFEHIEFFWLTIAEMTRVLKKGGLLCIIVPRDLVRHRYPVDCYRFDADGMVALARYCNLVPLHVSTNLAPKNANIEWYCDSSTDTILIAKKPKDWSGMLNLENYNCIAPDLKALATGFLDFEEYKYSECTHKEIHNFENITTSERIKVNIDKYAKVNNVTQIIGWAFLEDTHTEKQQIYIQITDKNNVMHTYKTRQNNRPDIGARFKDDRYNFSGFTMTIKNDINLEDVEMNFIIKNNDGLFITIPFKPRITK